MYGIYGEKPFQISELTKVFALVWTCMARDDVVREYKNESAMIMPKILEEEGLFWLYLDGSKATVASKINRESRFKDVIRLS